MWNRAADVLERKYSHPLRTDYAAGRVHSRQGKMQFACGSGGVVGTVLGALWYWHKLLVKRLQRLANRYGKWLGLSAQDIEARRWFNKHGKAVFFCRLVPGATPDFDSSRQQYAIGAIPTHSTLGTLVGGFANIGCGRIMSL